MDSKIIILMFALFIATTGSYIAINANPELFNFSSKEKVEDSKFSEEELSFSEYTELWDSRIEDSK